MRALAVLILCLQPLIGTAQLRFGNITEIGAGFLIKDPILNREYPANADDDFELTRQRKPAIETWSAFGLSWSQRVFLGLGGGYGYRFAEDTMSAAHAMRGYLQFRLCFVNRRLSPTFGGKGGYTFYQSGSGAGLMDNARVNWDGFFVTPELGMAIKVHERLALSLNLGYRFDRLWNRVPNVMADLSGNPEGFKNRDELLTHTFLLSLGLMIR